MSALERLQDLLERATPGPWGWLFMPGGEHESDEDLLMSLVNGGGTVLSSDGGYWPERGGSDARLIALAPVLASNLIALAEAAAVVLNAAHPRTCPYQWNYEHGIKRGPCTCGYMDTSAALSTVLAHIDDSLPEVDHHHQVAANAARPSVGDEPVLEGVADRARIAALEAEVRGAAATFDTAAHAIEMELSAGRPISMGDSKEDDARWLRSEADRLRALIANGVM